MIAKPFRSLSLPRRKPRKRTVPTLGLTGAILTLIGGAVLAWRQLRKEQPEQQASPKAPAMAAAQSNTPAPAKTAPEPARTATLPTVGQVGGRTGGEPTQTENNASPADYSATMGSLPASESDAPAMAGATNDQGTLADFIPIDGIGPRINEILHDAGVTTYSMLAEADAERLREILDTAGLAMADPTTWPEQARLAAAGDWDGLEALKKDLKTRSI